MKWIKPQQSDLNNVAFRWVFYFVASTQPFNRQAAEAWKNSSIEKKGQWFAVSWPGNGMASWKRLTVRLLPCMRNRRHYTMSSFPVRERIITERRLRTNGEKNTRWKATWLRIRNLTELRAKIQSEKRETEGRKQPNFVYEILLESEMPNCADLEKNSCWIRPTRVIDTHTVYVHWPELFRP